MRLDRRQYGTVEDGFKPEANSSNYPDSHWFSQPRAHIFGAHYASSAKDTARLLSPRCMTGSLQLGLMIVAEKDHSGSLVRVRLEERRPATSIKDFFSGASSSSSQTPQRCNSLRR